MAFDWPRSHKWEENIEREVTDGLTELIQEQYGVEEIHELTEEQLNEVMAFREELSEYSPLQWAFSNVYNQWEMDNE
jgi:hypothetical protein